MPDLFIPLDTSKYYIYYNMLNRKNVVYTTMLDIMDQNRASFVQKYPDFNTFNDKFEVTDEMVDKVLEAGEKADADKLEPAKIVAPTDEKANLKNKKPEKDQKEIKKEPYKPDAKSIEFARPLLKKQIKGLIARDLFSMSHYFQVMNADDNAIKKAIEVINKRGEYERILSGK
jgi:carboxyl-terminal processing protease